MCGNFPGGNFPFTGNFTFFSNAGKTENVLELEFDRFWETSL